LLGLILLTECNVFEVEAGLASTYCNTAGSG